MNKLSFKSTAIILLFLFSANNLVYGFIFRNRNVTTDEVEYQTVLSLDELYFDTVEYEIEYEPVFFEEINYERLEAMRALDTIDVVVPAEFTRKLDYLVNSWMVNLSQNPECIPDALPVITTDSAYKARLASLPHVIEMPFNSHVRSMIELYTVRRPRQVSQLLALSEFYFPIFEQALDAHGLPLEFRYLPVIESALHNRAVSHMGAAGLWQFMIATGRAYGLEINSLIDERLDPVKSSDAAARFLRDLYRMYGDWHMVLAAYNCGPGNVNRAIRRSGGKRDFWAIFPYLPRETRSFVPIFIAANYAMNFASEHNICPATITRPVFVDTIMITERVHFEQIASVLDIPIELIRTLNPQYRRDLIPGDLRPFSLRLPFKYANAFVEYRDLIVAYRADELVNNRRAEVDAMRTSQPSRGSGNATIHTVRSGETLGHIARRYGVTVAQLRSWNNIPSNSSRINVGQRLRIYR